MKRGEIWWASLASPTGSGPGFRRPVLIIQGNDFNRSKIRTVVVASISSNLALEKAPGNVRIPKRSSALSKDSIVNVSQLLTIDRQLLTEKVGTLNPSLMGDVNDGLRIVLGF